jgi:hypothetical protein
MIMSLNFLQVFHTIHSNKRKLDKKDFDRWAVIHREIKYSFFNKSGACGVNNVPSIKQKKPS